MASKIPRIKYRDGRNCGADHAYDEYCSAPIEKAPIKTLRKLFHRYAEQADIAENWMDLIDRELKRRKRRDK